MSSEIQVLNLFFNEYYNLDEIASICCITVDDVKRTLANYIINNNNNKFPCVLI